MLRALLVISLTACHSSARPAVVVAAAPAVAAPRAAPGVAIVGTHVTIDGLPISSTPNIDELEARYGKADRVVEDGHQRTHTWDRLGIRAFEKLRTPVWRRDHAVSGVSFLLHDGAGHAAYMPLSLPAAIYAHPMTLDGIALAAPTALAAVAKLPETHSELDGVRAYRGTFTVFVSRTETTILFYQWPLTPQYEACMNHHCQALSGVHLDSRLRCQRGDGAGCTMLGFFALSESDGTVESRRVNANALFIKACKLGDATACRFVQDP